MMAGVGTGAVAGAVQAAGSGSDAGPVQTLAALSTPEPVAVELIIEDAGGAVESTAATTPGAPASPAASAARATKPQKAAPPAGASPTVYAPVPAQAPSAVAAPVDCDRLEDKKIHWLLDLVAKTKASHPDQAATADWVAGQLRAQLGRNICAEEAQVYFSSMCAEPGVKNFMHLMVDELPFWIRPLVGDPCTKDIVAAANKWL